MPSTMTTIQKLQLLDIRARLFEGLSLWVIALPSAATICLSSTWPIYVCGGISLLLLIAAIYTQKTLLPAFSLVQLLLVMAPLAALFGPWVAHQGIEPVRAFLLSGMSSLLPFYFYRSSMHCIERQLKLAKDWFDQGLITKDSWDDLREILLSCILF